MNTRIFLLIIFTFYNTWSQEYLGWVNSDNHQIVVADSFYSELYSAEYDSNYVVENIVVLDSQIFISGSHFGRVASGYEHYGEIYLLTHKGLKSFTKNHCEIHLSMLDLNDNYLVYLEFEEKFQNSLILRELSTGWETNISSNLWLHSPLISPDSKKVLYINMSDHFVYYIKSKEVINITNYSEKYPSWDRLDLLYFDLFRLSPIWINNNEYVYSDVDSSLTIVNVQNKKIQKIYKRIKFSGDGVFIKNDRVFLVSREEKQNEFKSHYRIVDFVNMEIESEGVFEGGIFGPTILSQEKIFFSGYVKDKFSIYLLDLKNNRIEKILKSPSNLTNPFVMKKE